MCVMALQPTIDQVARRVSDTSLLLVQIMFEGMDWEFFRWLSQAIRGVSRVPDETSLVSLISSYF